MATKHFLQVYDCTVNYLKNPCGIDETPSFSYKVSSSKRGDTQISRRIQVTEALSGKIVWDSGYIHTSEQLFIPYEGETLLPLTKYHYTIYITTSSGQSGEACGNFVTGKLHSKWIAKWITAESVRREPDTYCAQYLRNTFTISKPVKAAYLAICGLGYFESYINGSKTGDDVLSPAFTRYDAESMYLVYDVLSLVTEGSNAIGVILGNGWYNCFTEDVWNTRTATWKHLPKVLCELKLTYEDNTVETIISDPTWKASKGPIIFNSIRNGEYYDARLELGNWTEISYDDSNWEPTKLMKSPGGLLIASELEPIRIRTSFPAQKMWKSKNGYIFDIGQNQAGVGHFKLRGKANTEFTFRYAEILNSEREINQDPVSCFTKTGEFQTDKYIKRSDEIEEWHARFSYHGFRYIEIIGMDYEPELSDVCALTLCSDVADIGSFQSSDELLNGIQHLCRWATISNMHSVPTDDPHREKNGWTGDVSLSCEQMLTNFGTRAFLSKWSQDLRTSQRPAGQIPCVVPSTGWGYYGLMGPDWSSALINIPYYIYLYNGDINILKKNYESVKRNFDFMETMTTDYTLHYGTGDWCAPFDGPGIGVNMGSYKCPVEVTDTGYFYYIALTIAKFAKVLGETEDELYYLEMASKIRNAFRTKYFDAENTMVMGDCQTATATMLFFGLYEENERIPLLNRLISQIEEKDWHLDFGVHGSKFVMQTLGAMGKSDIALRMMGQKTYPSLQWWLDQGATTLWECWNGGGEKNGSRNNHMFSDFSAFLYKYIGGISPDDTEPGFVHTIIRPALDFGIESASASHNSMYGMVSCDWTNQNDTLSISIKIPFGCYATLCLPKKYTETLNENGTPITELGVLTSSAAFAKNQHLPETNFAFIQLQSGEYHLTTT